MLLLYLSDISTNFLVSYLSPFDFFGNAPICVFFDFVFWVQM